MNEILSFIAKFHKSNGVDETFTCGCCYWYAYILCGRFPDGEMMYDPVANHFMADIDGRLFDITGDVTSEYHPIKWANFEDDLERRRIIDQCIDF